jgi:hypothetical protein
MIFDFILNIDCGANHLFADVFLFFHNYVVTILRFGIEFYLKLPNYNQSFDFNLNPE